MQDIRLRYGRANFSLLVPYAALISVCYILPVIKYSVPYIVLGAALLLTYVFSVFGQKIDREVILPTVFCGFGLMMFTSVITQPGNITEGINAFIRALRFIAPGILFLSFSRSKAGTKGEKLLIFLVITAVMLLHNFSL